MSKFYVWFAISIFAISIRNFASALDHSHEKRNEWEFDEDDFDNDYFRKEMSADADWGEPLADQLENLTGNKDRSDDTDAFADTTKHQSLSAGEDIAFTPNPFKDFDESFSEDELESDFFDPESDISNSFLHNRKKRSHQNLLNLIIENLRHDIDRTKKVRRKCLPFEMISNSRAITTCSSANTTLGRVKWCRFQCKPGFRLLNSVPQYELCGLPTKYRWSYELKGFDKATERCVKGYRRSKTSTCTTPECFETASYYMNKIDYSVNPCDNFFDFACGRWQKETKIPKTKGYYHTYAIIRDRVVKQVGELLEQPWSDSDPSAIVKAKIFYMSCLDINRINALDAEPLLDMLQGDMAWPIIQKSWDEKSFDFETTVAHLRGKYNNKVVMPAKLGNKGDHFTLELWRGKMPLEFPIYIEKRHKKALDAYYSLMFDLAVMLGASPVMAFLEVKKIMKFELELTLCKKDASELIEEETIASLQDSVPELNWLKMFQTMMEYRPIDLNTSVSVWNKDYFKKLAALVQKTDKRTVQNYMVWTMVRHRLKNLSDRFEKRRLQYLKEAKGVHALPQRKDKCAEELMFSLKGPTSKLFIDVHFSKAKKEAATELFDFVRKGFISLVKTEVNWMDNETKSYAIRKAADMKSNIGYNPHLYKNITYLNQQSKHLIVSLNDYFGNYLRVLEQEAQNKFAKIGKKYDPQRDSFHTRATMVNAFYNPETNTMTLPGGEMQYPFYWGDAYPRVFQFGAIGTILGHEVTHGFDKDGRRHGIDGDITDWWSSKSLEEFKKRVKCIENQYNKFFWKSAKEYLDGTKELDENIADNGGIRNSYAGYHLWLKSKNLSREKIEPATGLSNDQMFFVGFANARCAFYSPQAAVYDLAVNVHSPGRFRVTGSLQNFDKFSQAFKCPVGSYMNPRHKCVIW